MPEAHDLDELLGLARRVALEAGALLTEHAARPRTGVETKSSGTDMVTATDRAIEALVIERLAAERPDDGLLGEEGTDREGTTGVRWVIDPLDGTTNYLYDFPAFCVSIGAEVDGAPAVGAVYDPVRDELFAAATGLGATRNDAPIAVNPITDLAHALVGTGFAYLPHLRSWQAGVVAHLLPRTRDIRRAGSAALDLCWVACGRLDATAERGLMRWDLTAGSVIATEAGARFAVSDDGGWNLVTSAAPGIAEEFFALVAAAERAAGPIPG